MSKLVSGGYCYAGNTKVKRIWLGCFNGVHLCVDDGDNFKEGRPFLAFSYEKCIPIVSEPVDEWQWLIADEVRNLTFYTEEDVARASHLCWTKIPETKRTRK